MVEKMEFRKIFDTIPEEFDKYRPRYSKELFDNLIDYAKIGEGKSVLELGPLYAFVGVVSVGWGSVIYPILKHQEKYKELPYTKCFVEYNASWLGEKVTGEKAVW